MNVKSIRYYMAACFFLSAIAGIGSGCGRYRDNSILYMPHNDFIKQDWTKLIDENRIGEKENIKVLNIGKTDHASYHLVQIRGKEEPHVHKDNDLIVVVKEGKGIIHVGEKSFEVAKGAIQVIPKGVEHYFENKCGCGSVAFTIFSPPFESKK